jgi:hypothetical protein
MESKGRSVLDTPLEPVIGLAEGETRWRSMTTCCGAAQSVTSLTRHPFAVGAAHATSVSALTSWQLGPQMAPS